MVLAGSQGCPAAYNAAVTMSAQCGQSRASGIMLIRQSLSARQNCFIMHHTTRRRSLVATASANGSSNGSHPSLNGSNGSRAGVNGHGAPPGASDMRRQPSVEELLGGVMYWRAQQIRQGADAHAAYPPVPPASADPAGGQASPTGSAPNSSGNGSSTGSSIGSGASEPHPPRSGPASLGAPSGALPMPDALAAYSAALAHSKLVTVHFRLRLRAQMGQRVKVVGACDYLGQWGLAGAPELRWAEGDTWHAAVQLPAGSVSEYKYVLLDASGTQVMAWQEGNNSVLAVRSSEAGAEGGLTVYDDWYPGPSAKLAVGNAPPASRDRRLAAWAGDLYSQLEAQRRDLRRSRVELAGAQQEAAAARVEAKRLREELAGRAAAEAKALEESRLSRQEAEVLRGELAVKALEQERATTALAHATAANAVLQAQLADTTATLQEAVELLTEQAAHEEGGEEQQQQEAQAPQQENETLLNQAVAERAPRKRRVTRKSPVASSSLSTNAAGPATPDAVAPQPVKRRGRPRKADLAAAAAQAALEAAQAAQEHAALQAEALAAS